MQVPPREQKVARTPRTLPPKQPLLIQDWMPDRRELFKTAVKLTATSRRAPNDH
jgi:hypothetical protein